MRGESPHNIAKRKGISVATVYNDLNAIARKFREQILQVDPMTLVAENLHVLDEMERVALYEVMQASRCKHKQVIKNAEGDDVEVEMEISDPNKSKFMSTALKARQAKIDLLLQTGIIPKEPEKMFATLQNLEKPIDGDEGDERTPEEIQESIEQLIKRGRRM